MELLVEYMTKGFLVMLSISMPCVLVAAGIGLVVGIIQAVTQVQEQTIAAAPKILAVFLVIIVGSFTFLNLLTGLFSQGVGIAFNVLAKQDNFALPSDYYKYTTPFQGEMDADRFKNVPSVEDIMKHPGKVPYIDKYDKSKFYPSSKTPSPRPSLIETNQILKGQ
ncbi:flagellar biosynthetic protein FliQ [bacterium]|nr:flagellar biosynthetic protein FliQ [bacterium]